MEEENHPSTPLISDIGDDSDDSFMRDFNDLVQIGRARDEMFRQSLDNLPTSSSSRSNHSEVPRSPNLDIHVPALHRQPSPALFTNSCTMRNASSFLSFGDSEGNRSSGLDQLFAQSVIWENISNIWNKFEQLQNSFNSLVKQNVRFAEGNAILESKQQVLSESMNQVNRTLSLLEAKNQSSQHQTVVRQKKTGPENSTPSFMKKSSRTHHHRRDEKDEEVDPEPEGPDADSDSEDSPNEDQRQLSNFSVKTPHWKQVKRYVASSRTYLQNHDLERFTPNRSSSASQAVSDLLASNRLWQILFTYGLDTQRGVLAWVPVPDAPYVAVSFTFLRALHTKIFKQKTPCMDKIYGILMLRPYTAPPDFNETQIGGIVNVLPHRFKKAFEKPENETFTSIEQIQNIFIAAGKVLKEAEKSYCVMPEEEFVDRMSSVNFSYNVMKPITEADFDVGKPNTGLLLHNNLLRSPLFRKVFRNNEYLHDKCMLPSKEMANFALPVSKAVLERITPIVEKIRIRKKIQLPSLEIATNAEANPIFHVGNGLSRGPEVLGDERLAVLDAVHQMYHSYESLVQPMSDMLRYDGDFSFTQQELTNLQNSISAPVPFLDFSDGMVTENDLFARPNADGHFSPEAIERLLQVQTPDHGDPIYGGADFGQDIFAQPPERQEPPQAQNRMEDVVTREVLKKTMVTTTTTLRVQRTSTQRHHPYWKKKQPNQDKKKE